MGFKIAIVLLLGEGFMNFNGQANICRACDRACVPEVAQKCEALVVTLPTSRLPQKRWSSQEVLVRSPDA